MRNALKALLPGKAVDCMRRLNRRLMQLRNHNRSVQAIFTEVYENHYWGGTKEDYYSGSGSDEELVRPYAELVIRFIRENQISSVVDLGCGDFRVGSRIKVDGVSYLGVDVVPSLIARNQAKYTGNGISFLCLDIIANDLPKTDLCLVRQVLQHLSNDQIRPVLRKLQQYHFVLITEHYPAPDVNIAIPNRDKPAGHDTRIIDNSAVFLNLPPFGIQPNGLLADVEVPNWLVRRGERLKTFVFEYPKLSDADNGGNLQR